MVLSSHITDKLKAVLPFVLAAFGSMLAGLVIARADIKLIALFAAAPLGLIISLYPVALLGLTMLISYVLAGLAQLYYPSLELIRWAVLPLSFVFLLHLLIDSSRHTAGVDERKKYDLLSLLLLAFLLLNVLSAVINRDSISSFAVGMKGYFQLWGLLFAMAFLTWDEKLMRTWIPMAIFYLSLIQVPFALHQYFIVAPSRESIAKGIVAVDIVSGTFGGSIDGGGANAVLAVFIFAVWSCVLALWKKRGISTAATIVITFVILFPVMINEAKVSIIYALVVFFFVFRKGIFTNSLRFLGISMLVFGMVAGLFYTYIMHAPEGKVDSWSGLIDYTIEYNISQDESFDGRLTRGASIELWVEDHGSVANTLFGYGVGASRSDKHNNLARRLGVKDPQSYGVGNLATIAVLWETGLVGFFVLTAIFVVAFKFSGKLERRYAEDKWLSGIFLGLQGAIVILYISMWHKNFFVFHIGLQIIVVTLFGFLTYWYRRGFLEQDQREPDGDRKNSSRDGRTT